MRHTLVRLIVATAALLLLPASAAAIPCPGDGPANVRVEHEPGLAGGVRPVWRDSGPVLKIDPRAGGYKPQLFADQLRRFMLMHGLAHFCQGHVTAAQKPRFADDPHYAGWSSPGAELAADCWAARQLASRGSSHIVRAAALMFEAGDGVFSGRADNPAAADRAARLRRCADLS
jgi:hypothetical protein